MREKPRDSERLQHMLEAIDNVFEFTNGLSLCDYKSNKMLRFAVAKNLEIVGEAAYLVTKDFKAQHTEVAWDDIIAMRHVLVHGYYHIKDERVWATIVADLPKLKEQLQKML